MIKLNKKAVGCMTLSALMMATPVMGVLCNMAPVPVFADEIDTNSVSENEKEETVKPNVSISIMAPDGWQKNSCRVSIKAEDLLNTGNFIIAKTEARIGQSSAWVDISESMSIEISENCSVYVQVTDQYGNVYSKNKSIKCFDKTKPTLNSAVNNGLLTVEAYDSESGVAAIYVNGYEFSELNNGTINVRLKKFDKGYEYFTIRAMDNSGNMSDTYKIKNPYYESEDSKNKNSGASTSIALPTSVTPTAPTTATATVTEHVATNSVGDEISFEEQKKAEMAKADQSEKESEGAIKESSEEYTRAENGKEFYTIQTASEKTFYLVIDRDGEDEKVYFLTEITENDLLNVTENTSEELPMNSAALESAIKSTEDDGEIIEEESETVMTPSDEVVDETEEAEPEVKKESNAGVYAVLGVFGMAAIAIYYFLKKKKKDEDNFLDEDDEEDEAEVYESDDEDEEKEEFIEEAEDDLASDVTETIDDEE